MPLCCAAGKFYCPRMASMNKPAYAAIQVCVCVHPFEPGVLVALPTSVQDVTCPSSMRTDLFAARAWCLSASPPAAFQLLLCCVVPVRLTQVHSPTKPVLVFVASRRQTRLTALDLISHAAADERPTQFLNMDPAEITVGVFFTDPSKRRVLIMI